MDFVGKSIGLHSGVGEKEGPPFHPTNSMDVQRVNHRPDVAKGHSDYDSISFPKYELQVRYKFLSFSSRLVPRVYWGDLTPPSSLLAHTPKCHAPICSNVPPPRARCGGSGGEAGVVGAHPPARLLARQPRLRRRPRLPRRRLRARTARPDAAPLPPATTGRAPQARRWAQEGISWGTAIEQRLGH